MVLTPSVSGVGGRVMSICMVPNHLISLKGFQRVSYSFPGPSLSIGSKSLRD